MSRIVIPRVDVIVHPIDTTVHPTYPPGYRWAVMVGGQQPADIEYCVGAGHETSVMKALVVGESHGVAACKSLRVFGVNASYAVTRVDFDPIPAEYDNRPLEIWG